MNRKPIIIAVVAAAVVILLIVLIILFFNKPAEVNNTTTGNPVIESYKNDLPQLESQAEQNPSDAKAIRNYAVALYATGDLEAAKEQYLRELQINPNDAVLHNNLGNIYRDSGEYQEAVNAYQKSIDLDKAQLNVYINLANLYIYVLQQPEMGYGVFQKGIENNSNNKLSLLLPLANAYKDAGLKEDAIRTYNEILELDPNNAAAKAILDTLQ